MQLGNYKKISAAKASAISATALEKLENERVPGRDSEVTVKEVLSPEMEARINAAEPLLEEWAEGYSGKGGVPGLKKSSQGSHIHCCKATSARLYLARRRGARLHCIPEHLG